MDPVSFRSHRHIDPIVDDQRHAERCQRGLERARLRDHRGGVMHLVTQLHQRRAAGRDRAGKIDEVVAAGVFRIDDGVEAQIELFHA